MSRYKENILKEEINKLPIKSFDGNIVVIENDADARKIIPYLRKQKVLGFDTETKPVFVKGRTNKVAILQLSTRTEAFIFRLNMLSAFAEINSLLANENIIKAGVAIRDDIKALKKLHDFEEKSFIELQTYVTQFGIKDASLVKLTANILGFKISKGERISNWERKSLKLSQLKYAATDAWVGFLIYDELSKSVRK